MIQHHAEREGLIEGKIIIIVNILNYLRSKPTRVKFIETTTMKSNKIQPPQLMLARLDAIGNSSKDEYRENYNFKKLNKLSSNKFSINNTSK